MSTVRGRMGTFSGVFTPSILTILGLILFLRIGFVVGTTGLGEALLIILVANAISILTSISLAAIATNLKIKGGGVYYIISRTLGLPFGGAIGLVLFAAQSISVGFYCVGFAEGIAAFTGIENYYFSQAVAALAAVAMIYLAWLGADLATRFQYVVMALVVAALISFGLGAYYHWNPGLLYQNMAPGNGWGQFWVMFAIFFPAVTGFTQGVNMSGDLANPGRSVPLGTGLAVGISLVIYLAVAVICAGTIPRATLIHDYSSMKTVAAYAPLIDAGVIAATLSSALASLLGAPRILQSLARDRVFRFLRPFADGEGSDNNPRRGTLLSGAIALAVVALGNLNMIAAVVSMFFVVTYGLLNYATYYEARGSSPSFRPSLRWYRPVISLAGGLGALGVMLAIDVTAGLIAAALVFGIFQYLRRSAIPARWADGQRSYRLQLVRENLFEANARPEHARDWRPQILAFSSDKVRRVRLLSFANWIEGNSGLTTVLRILEGKGRHIREARERAETELEETLKETGSRAFPLVVSSPNLDEAVQVAVQTVGVGPTRINTVLVNWPAQMPQDDTPEKRRFARNLHIAYSLGNNLLILDSGEGEWSRLLATPSHRRVIDVWWRDSRVGRLMLVLAYLLTRDESWSNAKIRVILAVDSADKAGELKRLEKILQDVRIPASALVVEAEPGKSEQIAKVSTESSIVFLPLVFRKQWFSDWQGDDLSTLLPRLPVTVLVMAAEDVDLSADPDEGEEGERATAADALEDALKARNEASRNLALARKKYGEILRRGAQPAAEGEVTTEDAAALIDQWQQVLTEEELNLSAAREIAEQFGISTGEE
ncbi:MAG TPA: amino acid permease [Rhizomicrobium sp.]|nr:amino acid permease [Rhizomicrobium sp.]